MAITTVRIPAAGGDNIRPTRGQEAVAVIGDPDAVATIEGLVRAIDAGGVGGAMLRVMTELARRGTLDAEVIARLMPDEIPSISHVAQLQRNAAARTAALREFGSFTAVQLAESRGAPTVNVHATPGRWLKERRLFAVDGPRERLFPAFQVEQGRPKPAVRRILSALPEGLSGWEVLLWFTGNNGWLGGWRPVDLLDAEPDRVVEAAHRLTASIDD